MAVRTLPPASAMIPCLAGCHQDEFAPEIWRVQYGARPKLPSLSAVSARRSSSINDVGPLTPGRIIDRNEWPAMRISTRACSACVDLPRKSQAAPATIGPQAPRWPSIARDRSRARPVAGISANVPAWHIALLGCDAEFGRYPAHSGHRSSSADQSRFMSTHPGSNERRRYRGCEHTGRSPEIGRSRCSERLSQWSSRPYRDVAERRRAASRARRDRGFAWARR